MITEDYVSFEVAKLLKEKGFDENCIQVYTLKKQHLLMADFYSIGMFVHNSYLNKEHPELITAPTLQMAMKWLREVHTIIIELHHQYRKEWYAIVSSENPLGIGVYTTSTFNTYEEACEAAIKYCLENLI